MHKDKSKSTLGQDHNGTMSVRESGIWANGRFQGHIEVLKSQTFQSRPVFSGHL